MVQLACWQTSQVEVAEQWRLQPADPALTQREGE